jgi:hypothetical protein
MRAIFFRAIVPLALLGAGIASLFYGSTRHTVAVSQEHEEEVSIPIPAPFGPGPPGREGEPFPGGPPIPGGPPDADGPGPGGPPNDMPPQPWQPPQMSVKVIKKVIETTDEPESKVLREVSVGGLTLAASGEIFRTYSGDEGPALCPT